jgi:hypothetical protein
LASDGKWKPQVWAIMSSWSIRKQWHVVYWKMARL